MFQEMVLVLHIGLGAGALLIAVLAVQAKKRRGFHTILGNAYHWVFLAMTLAACALVAMDFQRLWWFAPIALVSYSFALMGFLVAKWKPRNWLRLHVVGQGGSFIAMCTAVAVVNIGADIWLAWVVPTAVGAPMLAWFGQEIKAGRRPKLT